MFQNIKDWVDEFKIAIVDYPDAPNLSWIVEYVPLLITAYENQGELLQLALGNTDKLNATLEDVQYKLRSCKSLAKLERENLLERNTDLISERKKSQDEADSIAQSMVNLRNQLDASHAVNDVYKNMMKVSELTIELLEVDGEE